MQEDSPTRRLCACALIALVAFAACSDDEPSAADASDTADTASTDAATPPTAAPQFPFLTRTDPASRALAQAVTAVTSAPSSQAELDAVQAAASSAQEDMALHASDAVARVDEALAPLPRTSKQRTLLHLLLAQIATPAATTLLAAEARAELSAPSAGHDTPRMAEALVRSSAIRSLGIAARVDGSGAGAALLSLCTAPDPSLRAEASRTYLSTAPERWRAKRALRAVLPAADRHLLTEFD